MFDFFGLGERRSDIIEIENEFGISCGLEEFFQDYNLIFVKDSRLVWFGGRVLYYRVLGNICFVKS